MANKNDIKIRGKVLSSSLLIEELLNKIIFNFFIPKSVDKTTRSKFLELFVFNKTFGGKKQIYCELLKTNRYKSKVVKQLKVAPVVINGIIIYDFKSFKSLVTENLTKVIEIRNVIAHGYDISKAFIALEENEFIFANKNKYKKISESDIDDYIKLTNDTLKLLEITAGSLQD
ncbi:hypothetical protein PW52_11000 [Tamlana sedimentorum]|uniref:RiboL-PSP-HEPN domain-containing protein n=1 Tax=Neotamlana sedimentorum TaxID=1435349 RepID=A0A0D7W7S0_9FLAO|nr:hypothetical protein [Tamlana sedimentorum]KJD35200.1 hypothetical protein PW52_11000 [Tamlana sedimentorum]